MDAKEKLLEILGTHPAFIKQEDLKAIFTDLTDARLARIVPDLTDASLARIVPYLTDASLARIVPYLTDARLARIVPYLTDASLARIVPYLTDASLARIVPDLTDASLARIEKMGGEVPRLEKPYTAILKAIGTDGCSLEMNQWHTCQTTHCLAGWTVHLAGQKGYDLEKRFKTVFQNGTPEAATFILLKSRPKAPLPNFYASNDEAMAFIKARAAEEVA